MSTLNNQILTTALSFGGGVDSSTIGAMDLNRPLAAELLDITIEELNVKLPAFNEVVFADTGNESDETIANVARFMAAFEAAGKTVHVVRRHEVVNQKSDDRGIIDWLMRLGSLPVMGGAAHVCSKLFKGETIEKAIGKRNFIIGIEADEARRTVFIPPKDGSTFVYPLLDLGITREMCLELLPKLGFAGVVKSSCGVCPFKSIEEIRDMWANDRKAWDICVAVEDNFKATSPVKHQLWIDAGKPVDSAGRATHGMWRLDSWAEGRRLFLKKVDGRQLSVHEWADKFQAEDDAKVSLIPLRRVA